MFNFQIQKCYQNETKFNCFYSSNNSPKIKNCSYVISLDGYKSIGSHWLALCVNYYKVTYFDTFGVEDIINKIKNFIGNKNSKTNIYRIQANYLIMCGYFSIGFIGFRQKGKGWWILATYFFLTNMKKVIK